jgi:hypothetical protein
LKKLLRAIAMSVAVFGAPFAHAAEPEQSSFVCDATSETGGGVNYLLIDLHIAPGGRRGELGHETYLHIIYGTGMDMSGRTHAIIRRTPDSNTI